MSSASFRQRGPRNRWIVAMTGRCRASITARPAPSSPCCARRTTLSVSSVTIVGRGDSNGGGAGSAARRNPGRGSGSLHAVGDQVLVVCRLAEPLGDQPAVDDDL